MHDFPSTYLYRAEVTVSPVAESFAELEKRGMEAFQWIYNTYGIGLVESYDTDCGNEDKEIYNVAGENATDEEFYKAVLLLKEELAKYPEDYIQACQIQRIAFVRTIKDTQTNEDYLGLCDNDIIFIAIGSCDRTTIQETIHHEIEHAAQGVFTDEAAKSMMSPEQTHSHHVTHTEWNAVNQKYGLTYGETDISLYEPKGFSSEEEATNILEDQARIMELLMTNPTMLYEHCQSDPALTEKVVLMKQELYWRSYEIMDEEQFVKIAEICERQRS